jgi:phage terminase large subunit-like protein
MTQLLVPRSDLSAVELLATAKPEDQAAVLAAMSEIEKQALLSWEALRRPSQSVPVDEEWFAWFFMGGRGSGKTRTAAEDTIDQVEAIHKRTLQLARWAVIAPTFGDFRDIDVEGESGLLAALDRRGIDHEWNRSHGELKTERWLIQGYSAEKPDRLRGPQFHGAWLDEPGSFRFPKYLWDNLLPALRLGVRPRLIVTGTPRITWLIKHLVEMAKKDATRYRLSRSTTWRNAANLPAMIIEILEASFGGTRLGRQELGGELLEEAEGALWTLDLLEDTRIMPHVSDREDDAATAAHRLDLRRIADELNLHKRCVAIDPAGSTGPDSDETGIIGGGCTAAQFPHAYVLGDRSGVFAPEVWARRAIDFAIEIGASRIVAEKNYGGLLVEANIRAAMRPDDPYIHIELIHAKVGKELRAGPVATYYQARRVHHVGTFGELETQMVTWVPGSEKTGEDSPDRVDADVYLVTDLLGGPLAAGGLSILSESISRV